MSEATTFMGVPAGDLNDFNADVVIMGIPCATPYMNTPGYGVANLAGPTAIRRAASRWAQAHQKVDWDVGSPALAGRVDRVVDVGDLPVRFNTPEKNREVIKAATEAVIARRAVPFGLGGEDSIPLPMVQGLSGLGEVTILQIDGHMDWLDNAAGERWGLSSGMRRASELPFVKNIVQVGMRGPSSAGPTEIADAKAWGAKIFTGEHVADHGVADVIAAIPEGANVHINFDLDSLDPSIMPAVWVPTPGGLSYWDVSKLFRGVARRAKIASFAMVEYVEERDPTGNAAALATRLAVTAMGEVIRSRYSR
ncbi:arginase family protein [Rhizobium leguminosarum]|uniref:arginase family protein n=1 Tax=Rhizobium leguminosarum TaxID=384 RepID=UPI0024A8A7FC|nr:arginase family protein [Rhizobium leguminosarum]MDI5930021.1 arginase family protein [Rhizobium leguminosarum]